MIHEARLRDDLIRLLKATEDNIRRRCDEESSVNAPLQDRYEAARKAGRTGMTFSTWREGEITQAGVAWLLACVFVRFLEDNDMLGEVYIAGPGDRLDQAKDRRTRWYRNHTLASDRDYLLDIFTELERLPGLKGLLDKAHNPLWWLGPDGDGAKAILDFFQDADPDTRILCHDFTDTVHNTRFLGDLYQNISESARKRYALLQTPDFIVDFILDRTLDEALKEFPLEGFRLIDPACGSGHFLLAAFDRLFPKWASTEGDLTVVVSKTLDCIYGVDLNPYAAAVARFRLLIAALRACGVKKIPGAPDWRIHISVGDSLLHTALHPHLNAERSEDADALERLLHGQRYHVVVGNPPYINVQDAELRRAYRKLYTSCYRNYQVSVPFTECFFRLAGAGAYVGTITSNGFAKQQFGKRLVQEFLPKWDITHVIDTSGVHLPGHGTGTAILFGRHRAPVGKQVRVVRGIRGEAVAPADPSNAPVWIEIRENVNHSGYCGTYVSVDDAERSTFHSHPWSIGGGGAAELKARLDSAGSPLQNHVSDLGEAGQTNADEVMMAPASAFKRKRLRDSVCRPVVLGEDLRDWQAYTKSCVLFPYAASLLPLATCDHFHRWLWPSRTVLGNRATFEQETYFKQGRPWWGWHQVSLGRYKAPISIAFAEVSTHAHFVLTPGSYVFNRSAPIIKLPEEKSKEDHVPILGLLNSSTVCFWLRQVCFPKRGDGIGRGIATESWEFRFHFNTTNVARIPVPATLPEAYGLELQRLADERSSLLPERQLSNSATTRAALNQAHEHSLELLLRMIAVQEELDWHVYYLYGLTSESLTLPIDQVPPVRLGERAFEITMARAMEDGELETEWFTRHDSRACATIPEHWPDAYRALVQRRLDVIARDRDIALIEQPEYKRRWNLPAWEDLEREALRNWLLDRLEDPRYWPTEPPALTSVARLADAVRLDSDFLQVAAVYRGREDFDLPALVHELVAKESVPFLSVLRYKESGLRKRQDWERTWELQRQEDRGEKVEILVPPRYEKDDFVSTDFWRLRGKLDIPKERFICYPHLERDADKSPVIAWAGYDHGQQALALASYCYEMRGNEVWGAERLTPILAGLQELQRWLDQWHADLDPNTQQRLNESIRTFFESELTQLEITAEKVRAWRPPARARRGASAGNNK